MIKSDRASFRWAWLVGLIVVGASCAVSRAAELPPFKVGLSTQIVSTGFEVSPAPPLASTPKLKYRPASSNYAGILLGYRWLSGTVSFSIPAQPEIRALEGLSQYRDYRLGLNFRRFGFDVYYNRYLGHLIENSSTLSAATIQGATYYKIPDLESISYGANLVWVFDDSKYSLAAALDQSELAESSGGSWVALGSFQQRVTSSTSGFIPSELRASYGADQALREFRLTSGGVGGGYAHQFTVGRFYFSLLAGLTLGYQSTRYLTEAFTDSVGGMNANILLRLGLGYNARNFFVTSNLYAEYFSAGTRTIKLGATNLGSTFSIGVRF